MHSDYHVNIEKNNTVRAHKIESGTGILVSKERFSELILSDIGMKITNDFELIIQNIDRHYVEVLFKGKNDTDWDKFVNVTEEFMKYMMLLKCKKLPI